MAVRAVRGAVQWERDEAGHMEERAGAPLTAVLERDEPRTGDPISLWFTATPDPRGDFPAAAVRKPGIADIPLLRAREADTEGAMPRVARVLAHIDSDRPRTGLAPVHPGAAAAPRKDIAQ